MDQYPSNRKLPDPPEIRGRGEEKRVQRVVQGEVIRRKTPLGRRMSQNLLGGNAQSVWGYMFGEVVIPAVRDMVADAVTGGVERMIFGDSSSTRGRRSRGSTSHTPYHQMSSRGARQRDEPRREISRRARSMHDFQEIILEGRAEAEEVLDRLFELIRKFDSASVADLYGMVGIPAHYTDDKYGWVDLGNARPVRVRGGYLLDLPQPEVLD